MWRCRLFLFISSALLALPVAADLNDVSNFEEQGEKRAHELMLSYDDPAIPQRETIATPANRPGYRSPKYGIQIHPSCFEYGRSTEPDRKRAEAKFEKWFAHSVADVFEGAHSGSANFSVSDRFYLTVVI